MPNVDNQGEVWCCPEATHLANRLQQRQQVGWVLFAEDRLPRFMHLFAKAAPPGDGWQPMWVEA